MNDALGDRMKSYEMAEAGRRFMPLLPILARIDGRCFSAFTAGMERPYDTGMADAMIATTADLQVERWRIEPINMPVFQTVTNREAVIFEGAEPTVESMSDAK